MLLRERAGAEDLRRAQAGTLRLRLIKLGARVTETARSVKLSPASNYPRARDWICLAGALGAVIG
ncbi:MAG: transposase [Armatimonadetes bacterium]|nr:transposase [Armatimonadota bacterium]